MKTFKTLDHFKKRLEKGVCWGDWIVVAGKTYKMVEYGGVSEDHRDYMLFQNKTTTDIIRVNYQCPTFSKGIQMKEYAFYDIEQYNNGELYRY